MKNKTEISREKNIEIETFLEYTSLNGLKSSPDKTRAMFITSSINFEKNGYNHSLWLYENEKFYKKIEALSTTTCYWHNNDEIIALKSKNSFESNFDIININSGKVVKSIKLPVNVKSLKKIKNNIYASLCVIDCDCPDYHKLSKEEQNKWREDKDYNKDVQVIDELPFWNDGSNYTNKKRNALFVIDMQNNICERISENLMHVSTYVVHGNDIVFEGESYDRIATLCHDIYVYSLTENTTKCLYDKKEYNMGNGNANDSGGLIKSGDKILVLANKNTLYGRRLHKTFYELDKTKGDISIFCDYPFGTNSCVSSDVRLGANPQYLVAEEKLFFRSTVGVNSHLVSLDESGVIKREFNSNGSVDGVAYVNGKYLMIAMQNTRLQELYILEDVDTAKQISDFNDNIIKNYYVGIPEYVQSQSEGNLIDGWVIKPINYNPTKKYPAILNIHGGPNTVYGTVFYHEMQVWANKGFFVFFCNPIGSEGKGDEFLAIEGQYGKIDYRSVMDFTDQVLKEYTAIDSTKLCVTGGSYGGFMTNWIIANTDRFACAGSQRSSSNQLTKILLADQGYHRGIDQAHGSLFENLDRVWECSPLKYAGNCVTPTLFINGAADYRCPLDQGMQMFSALIQKGVEARMCIFDKESHGFTRNGKPSNRIRVLKELTDWFIKYTK